MSTADVTRLVELMENGDWRPPSTTAAAVALVLAHNAVDRNGFVAVNQALYARALNTSHSTISRAFRELGKAGLLFTEPGTRGRFWLRLPELSRTGPPEVLVAPGERTRKRPPEALQSPPAPETPPAPVSVPPVQPVELKPPREVIADEIRSLWPDGDIPELWQLAYPPLEEEMALAGRAEELGVLAFAEEIPDGPVVYRIADWVRRPEPVAAE